MKQNGLSENLPVSAAESLAALWQRYLAARSDADRDALARHYFAWAKQTAGKIARRLRIADWENAVGDALLTMSTRAIQSFKGVGRFEGFATECMKRTLISAQRRERPDMLSLDARCDDIAWADLLAAKPLPQACECRFQEVVASLDDRSACLLWLRYQRGLSRAEAAEALGLSEEQTHYELQKSYERLRRDPGARSSHRAR